MTTQFAYRGYVYWAGNIDELVQGLVDHPDDVPNFQDANLRMITGTIAWGAYGVAFDQFEMMCDVLMAVDRALGKSVLAPQEVEVSDFTSKITHDNSP